MRYSKEFRKELRNKILDRISAGTCVSVVGLPGLGKTDFITYLVSSSTESHQNLICIRFDVNDLVHISEEEFLKYLLTLLIEEASMIENPPESLKIQIHKAESMLTSSELMLTYNTVKKLLWEILKSTDKSIGIFLDGFSKLQGLPIAFFNSLRGLRTVDKFRIAYVFIDDSNYLNNLSRDNIGDLYDLITSHIVWIPFPNKEEAFKIIDNCQQIANLTLSLQQKEKIYDITKGHASLTKYLILSLSENPEKDLQSDFSLLIQQTPLRVRIEKIISGLSASDITLLTEVAHHKLSSPDEIPSEAKHLLESSILITEQGDHTLSLFSPLVSTYLLESNRTSESTEVSHPRKTDKPQEHLSSRIIVKDGNVFIDGSAIEEDLTETEYKVLQLLLSEAHTVVPREKVAKIMWEDKSDSKYSDWAIDRAISRLRKKIGDDAYKPHFLKTLRGRGFKLTP